MEAIKLVSIGGDNILEGVVCRSILKRRKVLLGGWNWKKVLLPVRFQPVEGRVDGQVMGRKLRLLLRIGKV